MAVTYLSSDHQIHGDQALSHVRQYYPGVTQVYCVRRIDDAYRFKTDPGTVRVRSRGRHNPGSGSYFCSHIDPPGKLNGYLVGSVFYATNLPFVGSESSTSVNKASYSYSSWQREEYTYGNNWSNYFLRIGTFDRISGSRIIWKVTTYHGAVRRGTYAQCKADAFSHEPAASQAEWGRLFYLNDEQHIPPPTFEDRFVQDKIENGTLPNLDAYLNDAYLRAFESLPIIQTNNIQNLQAVFDLLKGFVNPWLIGDKLVKGVGTLSDAWLGYRYVYNTTKSDIQEIVAHVDRTRYLGMTKTFKAYGATHATIGGDSYYIRCSLTTTLTDVFGCYSELERLGLALDGYNAWDMIPYSFMVDWFLHIGDLIEKGRNWSHALKLTPSDGWFSITHDFTNKYGGQQCDYFRWPAVGVGRPSSMLPASMLSHQQSRGSTWVKRGADALAIFS